MNHRIVLLRAVNVGGRKLLMAPLKAALTARGHAEVTTLLASGNVVLRSDAAPAELEQRLEAEVLADFGIRSEMLVRTPSEWAEIIAADPFPDFARDDPSHLLVSVMRRDPTPEEVDHLRSLAVPGELVAAGPRCLFTTFPLGIGPSVMSAPKHWKRLQPVTGRNWSTVLKLGRLVGV